MNTSFDLDNVRWRTARNDSGEDIPPHSVVKLSSFDTDTGEHVIIKPDRDSMTVRVAVTGATTFKAGTTGHVSFDWPNYIRYQEAGSGSGSGSSPPALDSTLGTVAGQWGCDPDQVGFICLAAGEANRQRVYAMLDPFATVDDDGSGSGSGDGCGGVSTSDLFQCDGDGNLKNLCLAIRNGRIVLLDPDTGAIVAGG